MHSYLSPNLAFYSFVYLKCFPSSQELWLLFRSLYSNDQREWLLWAIFHKETTSVHLSSTHWLTDPFNPASEERHIQFPCQGRYEGRHSTASQVEPEIEPIMTVKSFRLHKKQFFNARKTSLLEILCQHEPSQRNTRRAHNSRRICPNTAPLPPNTAPGIPAEQEQ